MDLPYTCIVVKRGGKYRRVFIKLDQQWDGRLMDCGRAIYMEII